jgi:hypothetical protein
MAHGFARTYKRIGWLMVAGAPATPTVAASHLGFACARMIAIQHQWGFGCDDALETIPDVTDRSRVRDQMHAAWSHGGTPARSRATVRRGSGADPPPANTVTSADRVK